MDKDQFENNMRVTAILGAGVNLEYFDWSDKTPSTANITKCIVSTKYFKHSDGSQSPIPSLIRKIYLRLCRKYPFGALNPKDNKSYGIMHFEKIFHALEELDSYDKIWTRHAKDPSYAQLFAHFTKPAFKYNPDEIHSALFWMASLIMDFVNYYNDYFITHKEGTCKWYTDFWRKASFKWDVFNFNYDTTIENSIDNFNDGYVDVEDHANIQRFDPNRLMQSKTNTINHIHGCILYGYGDFSIEEENRDLIFKYGFHDWFKWDNYELNKKHWIGRSSSSEVSQSGGTLFPSPIITGLNKTDKLLTLPFSTYRLNLSQRLFQSHALLIAGYSFGDYYVNYELERMRLYHGDKLRVVLIDYWDLQNYRDMSDQDKIHAYLEFGEIDGISHQKACFIEKVIHSSQLDYYKNGFKKLTHKNYMISDNKQLMLFVGGWKNALQYRDKIYEFLCS